MGKFRSAKKKTKTTMMHSRIALISAIGVIYLGTVAAGQNDHHRQHDTDDPMRRFVADRVTRRRCFQNNEVQAPPRRLLGAEVKMLCGNNPYILKAACCGFLAYCAYLSKWMLGLIDEIFRPLKQEQDEEEKRKKEDADASRRNERRR